MSLPPSHILSKNTEKIKVFVSYHKYCNKLEDFKYRKETETDFLNKDKSYQPNLF
tara:strand:- start:130 stop:294 length:165 start_codon:yes stop_codon:yes gene_type:complete